MTEPVIGLDLDNTLVSYDRLFHALAVERGLIDSGLPRHKRHIRDAIRAIEGGELQWRVLQSLAYGDRMRDADLAEGVPEFMRACRARRMPVHIVSHRSERAAADPSGTNLRESALAFMRDRGFFGPDGLGVDPARVWFEPTRVEKVARIAQLGCNYFIDDLEEVFREDTFPTKVVKILFAPDAITPLTTLTGLRIATSWTAIHEVVFEGK